MKISFVIPAFNEEALIGACLSSVQSACAAQPGPPLDYECIVTDNNSTDRTAELAEQASARVVFEPLNQIARARNAGAAAATGDWLIFIDADSTLNAGLLADVLRLIETGQYAGCGSVMQMDDIPLIARFSLWCWKQLSIRKGWAAGSFVVCRKDLFDAIGGFSNELYVTEEIDFSRRLQAEAVTHGLAFTVLTEHPLQTSNRKMHLYSKREQFMQFIRLALRPRSSPRRKSSLGVWYDGRR